MKIRQKCINLNFHKNKLDHATLNRCLDMVSSDVLRDFFWPSFWKSALTLHPRLEPYTWGYWNQVVGPWTKSTEDACTKRMTWPSSFQHDLRGKRNLQLTTPATSWTGARNFIHWWPLLHKLTQSIEFRKYSAGMTEFRKILASSKLIQGMAVMGHRTIASTTLKINSY